MATKRDYEGPVYTSPYGVIETYQDPPGFYVACYVGTDDMFGMSDIGFDDAAKQLLAISSDEYFETGHTRPTKRS